MSISWHSQIVHTDDYGYRIEFFDSKGLNVCLEFQGGELVSKVRSIWVSFQSLYMFVNSDEGKLFTIQVEQGKVVLIDSRYKYEQRYYFRNNPMAVKIVQFLDVNNLLEQSVVAGQWREVCQLENKAYKIYS